MSHTIFTSQMLKVKVSRSFSKKSSLTELVINSLVKIWKLNIKQYFLEKNTYSDYKSYIV